MAKGYWVSCVRSNDALAEYAKYMAGGGKFHGSRPYERTVVVEFFEQALATHEGDAYQAAAGSSKAR